MKFQKRSKVFFAFLLTITLIASNLVFAAAKEPLSPVYQGKGSVVAVISYGFATESMKPLSYPDSAAIQKCAIEEAIPSLKASQLQKIAVSDVYQNDKIPFFFRYTGVSPYAANESFTGKTLVTIISGLAPEAQILAMEIDANAKDEKLVEFSMCAAIDDAVALGADAIVFHFGSIAGFEKNYSLSTDLDASLCNAYEKGVSIVCPASDFSMTGGGSIYDSSYGIKQPSVENPDYGTVAYPATSPYTIAVGGMESDKSRGAYFLGGKNDKIPYSDTTSLYPSLAKKGVSAYFAGQTLEYVAIPDLGKKEAYAAVGDLTGKLALIERGVLSFSEKANLAQEHGAIGAIIYNNVEKMDVVQMDLSDTELPAVFISYEDGQKLLDSTQKTIAFPETLTGLYPNPKANTVNERSSWGVTPSLKLKPEVVAFVTDILQENSLSSTTVSAAYTAGTIALIRQYLRESNLDVGLTKNILLSSAVPLLHPLVEVEYSPRVQGAGKATIENATQIKAILSDTHTGESKIELGDHLKSSFTIPFVLENLTDKEQKYWVSASVMGDGYDSYAEQIEAVNAAIGLAMEKEIPYFVNGLPQAFPDAIVTLGSGNKNVNPHASSYHADTITVQPHSTTQGVLHVMIDSKTAAEYGKIFSNGYFAEGFITLKPMNKNDTGVVSVPYVGFVGDWSKVPLFGVMAYDETGDSFYEGQSLCSSVADYTINGTVELGIGFFEPTGYDQKLIAFSPNGDGCADDISVRMNFLRNIFQYRYTITDKDGTAVVSVEGEEVLQKSYYVPSQASAMTNFIYLWDGSIPDNASYILPDGAYTLTFTAFMDENGTSQTFRVPVQIDTEKPEVLSYQLVKEGDTTYLEITAKDNQSIQFIKTYSMYADKMGEFDDLQLISSMEANEPVVKRIDITGITEDDLYIDLYDYAYNKTTVKINLVSLYAEL